MKFKCEFNVCVEDINNSFEVTNKSILKFFENAACFHSDSIGSGLNDVFKIGRTWVLLDWYLNVVKRPKYGDKITVYTWSKPGNSHYSYREFELYVNEKIYAKASSKWVLIDIINKCPIAITKEIESKYLPVDENALNKDVFSKLEVNTDFINIYDILLRKTDMDFNNHLHNLNYLDFIIDSGYNLDNYANLRIFYKREIKFDDSIQVGVSKKDNKIQFVFLKNEEVKTIIECF